MIRRTHFNWLSFYDIDVVVADEGDRIRLGSGTPFIMPDMLGESVRRVNEDGSTYFLLAFSAKHTPTAELVAHECFHLFFQIMEYQGEEPLSMTELRGELYAMAFETLIHRTLEALDRLGAFKDEKEVSAG